jgi:RNA polymerase sigma factor (sigma-70 family)
VHDGGGLSYRSEMMREPINRDDDVSPILEEHVQRYAGLVDHAIRRYGLSRLDREELEQEVRLKLWTARRTGEAISGLSTSYVYRTVMSAAIDMTRRRRPTVHETPLRDPRRGDRTRELSVCDADPIDSDDIRQRLERALARLAAPRRFAVGLYLAGYPRAEIADAMHWSEARTRNLLYRGLAELRSGLREPQL